MPIFGGILASMFSSIFTYFTARFSLGVAFALAAAATSTAAMIALQAALHAVWSGVSLVAPTIVVDAFAMVMPSNFSTFLSGIILVDVIRAAYDYWRQTANTTFLAKSAIS